MNPFNITASLSHLANFNRLLQSHVQLRKRPAMTLVTKPLKPTRSSGIMSKSFFTDLSKDILSDMTYLREKP